MQIENFEDLPLTPEVMKGIEELGFSNLFPIQAQAIIPLLEGKDVIGQAQTGTGKTAAFGIPMVERVKFESSASLRRRTHPKTNPRTGKRRPYCCWYARQINRPSETRNIKSVINKNCCS